jgi:hypothetical protein
MKDNTVVLVLALALAIAGVVLGVVGRAWAVVLVGIATTLLVALSLF